MAQYMKKASLGRMVKAEGGASDPELAEVRLTADEYSELWRRIHSAERATKEAEEDAVSRENAAYRSANKQLAEYKEQTQKDADRRVAAAQKAQNDAENRAEYAESELERQRNLNNNLKRIARERANQARNIRPKKDHDGYLVMISRQWTEHYEYEYTKEEYDALDSSFRNRHSFPYKEKRTASAWKSTIQTPYDASLPLNQIRGQIMSDLWNGGVLEDIGCPKMLKDEYNGTYHEWPDEDGHGVNGMYRWTFQANYKAGYWELEIFTTKSLRVPEGRRPVPKNRIVGKSEKKKRKEQFADDSQLFEDSGWGW